MQNILVALDDNEYSKILINQAIALAEKSSSKLWFIHVTAPEPDFVGYDAGPQFTRDERAQEIKSEHVWIQEMADLAKAKNIDCEGLLVQGPTVATILEEAVRLHADLIVLGYQEHGFLYNAWYGDNTFEVIKKAAVPVYVIPLRDAE